MDKIKEVLKQNRSHLADSSLATYSSNLKNLFYKVFGEIPIDINLFNNYEKIMKFLENYEPQKRKTYLASLYILTLNPNYQKQMNKDISHYNENVKMQIKDHTQKNYWLSKEELNNIYQQTREIAEHTYKKKNLTMDDKQQILNYIILSLYLLTPPRRSGDYIFMKVRNIDTNENYILKNKFIFNKYKTSSTYGQQIEEIPKQLQSILKKWIKVNDNDYLLFDNNGNKMTNSKLTHKLNRIFKKKLSTSALRHLFISHKYEDLIKQQEELESDLKHMGSSIIQKDVYLKK
jgi:hypothetical protein